MVPAIFISIQMTGSPVPQLGWELEVQMAYLLEKLNGLSTEWVLPNILKEQNLL